MPLQAVVRAGRVAGRRPYAPVLSGKKIISRCIPFSLIAPEPYPHLLVEVLGERFGQAVADRAGENGAVLIAVILASLHDLIRAEARGEREHAYPVLRAGLFRRDEVGKRAALIFVMLLPQHGEELGAAILRLSDDVVSPRECPEETDDGPRSDGALLLRVLKERLGILHQLPCLCPELRALQDVRVLALEPPDGEERRPVDIAPELRD